MNTLTPTKTEQALRSDLEGTLMQLKALSSFARISTGELGKDCGGMTGKDLWGIFSALDDLAEKAQTQFYTLGKIEILDSTNKRNSLLRN